MWDKIIRKIKQVMVASKFIRVDGLLVIDESNKNQVTKKDLMEYLDFLVMIIPYAFVNQEQDIPSFLKKVGHKKKMEMVEIINYGVQNRHNISNFNVSKKGVDTDDLVRVTVKQIVKKIVQ